MFSGTPGPAGTGDHVAGVNSPSTDVFPSAAWVLTYDGPLVGNGNSWDGDYGNSIDIIGGVANVSGEYDVIAPDETYYLDKKLDDGKPSTGIVRTYNGVTENIDCVLSTDPQDAEYNLTHDEPACAFRRLRAF